MNILIEPIYSGLTQSVLSLLIISGIIFFGEFFNKFFLKKYNYIFFNHLLKRCVGNKFAQSKNFTKSTRNPFNSGIQFNLTLYEFEYKKLPNCIKK